MTENEIGDIIVRTAIEIHRELGPGLLESVYEEILYHELTEKGLHCERQKLVSITYKKRKYSEAFRADLIVEGKVIAELKSVEEVHKSTPKQILTYLKLTNMKLGYILNFGAPLMKDGIKRIANNL